MKKVRGSLAPNIEQTYSNIFFFYSGNTRQKHFTWTISKWLQEKYLIPLARKAGSLYRRLVRKITYYSASSSGERIESPAYLTCKLNNFCLPHLMFSFTVIVIAASKKVAG